MVGGGAGFEGGAIGLGEGGEGVDGGYEGLQNGKFGVVLEGEVCACWGGLGLLVWYCQLVFVEEGRDGMSG